MATSTSNLGLIKPAGTDHALVSNINTNSDTIDTEAGKARANFALVQNGDTATQAISKDQLVVWKGVLKKASANIASGATLSSSNLSDDTIAAELAALNSNISNVKFTPIIYSGASFIAAFQLLFDSMSDGETKIAIISTGVNECCIAFKLNSNFGGGISYGYNGVRCYKINEGHTATETEIVGW